MKQALPRKLRSRRGASFLFALLFFLVVAVFSSIMITSATANAGRLSTTPDTQQDYLTLSSAAKLVRTLLNNTVYKYQLESKVTYRILGNSGKEKISATTPVQLSSRTNLSLSSLDQKLTGIFQDFAKGNSSSGTLQFTVTPAEGLDPVNVSLLLSLRGETSLEAEATLTNEAKALSMTVKVSGAIGTRTDSVLGIEIPGNNGGGNGNKQRTDTETTTTEISFFGGTISKGGAAD